MSQENVEIVRLAYEAFATGDMEAVRAIVHPEAVLDVTRTHLEPRVFHGHDGFAELLDSWTAVWDDYRAELDELIDAGDRYVVAVVRESGGPPGSQGRVEHRRGAVFTVSDGRITRYEEHHDKQDALSALGGTS
jgi:ketosteroid isomerase-like protein